MSADPLEIYRRALAEGGCHTAEDGAAFAGMSELEWQARWFAGEFGREWKSVDGATVRIEDFGRWNREPGPDFVDARVRIDGRELIGAIELDPDARDWERHGHGASAAFRETVLHVFMTAPARRFFTRTDEHREVAQVHLLPERHAPSAAARDISFDAARVAGILHAAARHRLDLKGRAIQRYAAAHGEDESWFAALAVCLGYKRNQTPFLLLAQRVGQRAASADGGEAMLFGTAGFLETPAAPHADRPVRAYLRALWEHWWSVRAGCERWILPSAAWIMGGNRPANHPHRRVAALAGIARNWKPIRKALAASSRLALIAALEDLEHPFWTTRFNLQGRPLPGPQALIGAERIRDILVNVHHPLAIARDAGAWKSFLAESAAAPAAIMRTTARRFFGAAADAKGFLTTAVVQQGLLQLERDHREAADPQAFAEALRRMPPGSTLEERAC